MGHRPTVGRAGRGRDSRRPNDMTRHVQFGAPNGGSMGKENELDCISALGDADDEFWAVHVSPSFVGISPRNQGRG